MPLTKAAVVATFVVAAGATGFAADRTTAVAITGVKLVDMQARTPERTCEVRVGEDGVSIVDPAARSQIARFAYGGLEVSHTFAVEPPASAGHASQAVTQPGSLPLYHGRSPRNWVTLRANGQETVLRVSAKVYDTLKEALAAHDVHVTEAK